MRYTKIPKSRTVRPIKIWRIFISLANAFRFSCTKSPFKREKRDDGLRDKNYCLSVFQMKESIKTRKRERNSEQNQQGKTS